MPFATRESDPIRSLAQPIARLSLNFNKFPGTVSVVSPPSYDPMSPSYDPGAASPCNPFPTTSPFVNVMFGKQASLSSRSTSEASSIAESNAQSPMQRVKSATAAVLSRIPPPHSAPSMRRTKPCRFYLDTAGCKSGRWCNFKHPVGAWPEDTENTGSLSEDNSLEKLRDAALRSRERSQESWDGVPDVRDVDPDWGKSTDGEVHPKYRTQPCRNFLLGLCKYGDKCQFIHPPGLFPPTTSPTSLPIPIGTLDSPLAIPVSVWGPHPMVNPVVPVESVLASPGTTANKLRQTSSCYRTKTCRVFNNRGSCPRGDRCKFIHDPSKFVPVCSSIASPVATTFWADDDRELDFDEEPIFDSLSSPRTMDVDSQSTPDVFSRNSSPFKERCCRTRSLSRTGKSGAIKAVAGVHKPTWRVLGGGVLLTSPDKGKRSDDQFVFEAEGEDDVEILTFQPCSSERSSSSIVSTPSSSATHHNSPNFFTAVNAPSTDLTEYSFATPTNFDLLGAPSSPDRTLNVTALGPYLWKTGAGGVGFGEAPMPKKNVVVTGAELLQARHQDSSPEGHSYPPVNCSQSSSSCRSARSSRARPRLTIAVPSTSQVHPVRHSPYPSPALRNVAKKQGLLEKAKNVWVPETVNEAGDDLLDWSEDDEAIVQAMEGGEMFEYSTEDEADVKTDGLSLSVGKEIRRPHSTPPTPCYAHVVTVPTLPPLPAETP